MGVPSSLYYDSGLEQKIPEIEAVLFEKGYKCHN